MQVLIKTKLFDWFWTAPILALLLGLIYTLGVRPVKTEQVSFKSILPTLIVGGVLYFGAILFFSFQKPISFYGYSTSLVLGYLFLLAGIIRLKRMIDNRLLADQFNKENRKFAQERRKLTNPYSVNIKTQDGWLNIINPFRGTIVLGTPGSGKSYTIVEAFIRQHIAKGFTLLLYDFKYPELSKVAYNSFLDYQYKHPNSRRKIYLVNLNDPINSHRINPIAPRFLRSPSDAIGAAESLFLNLNKEFIKRKDFFSSSAVNLIGAIIWYLRKQEDGKYCTLPHVISLLNHGDEVLFRLLQTEPEVHALLSPFKDALDKKAFNQLAGQTASARIPISRLATKQLYWILGGEDFNLEINHPDHPALLFLANHPQSQDSYAPIYGLIASTLVKLVNQKGRLPLSLIIDELPTIYINGLDHLIATARSNKISTLLSFQDLSQLERDYGKEIANAIFNTVGNKISGAVVADTAKKVSEMIGKTLQRRRSINYSSRGTTLGNTTTMDYLVPPEAISQLSQGEFCGVLADTHEQSLKQKIFHSNLIASKKKGEEQSIPSLNKNDQVYFEQLMEQNFQQINREVEQLIDQLEFRNSA